MSLDFDRIVLAHAAWKTKLRAYLRDPGEGLSVREAADPTRCKLGRWLGGEGRVHADSAEFAQLSAIHADFHRAAADVIVAIDRGEADEAALLGPASAYDRAARQMVAALKAMRQVVGL